MARVQYGIGITSLKGSVGGVTFQNNRSGAIVRSRPRGSRVSTPKQQLSHLNQNTYLREWQLLDIFFKQAWNDYADTWEREDMFGNLRTLTGLNWFNSTNRNRVLGGNIITREPPIHALPVSPPNYLLLVADDELSITFEIPFNPPTTALIIRTTAPFRRVSDSIASNLRETLILTSPPWSTINLKLAWSDTHGLPYPPSTPTEGYYIGVMVQTLHVKSGITSPGLIQIGEMLPTDVGVGQMVIGYTFVIRPNVGIGEMEIGNNFIIY